MRLGSSARRIVTALYSPAGIVGWVVALAKPIRSAVDWLSDMDFVSSNMAAIGAFLNTGWGTLASVCAGALILGHAIQRSLHAAPVQETGSAISDLQREKKLPLKGAEITPDQHSETLPARDEDDYAYGLSLERVSGEINPDKPNIYMSWQLGVKNCTDGAVRYRFDTNRHCF
jgi:hypothetical protein